MDDKEAIRAKAIEWLATHWNGSDDCPICEDNTWSVTGDLSELLTFKEQAIALGEEPRVYPVFLVTCNNCGFTHTFNAIVAGLVPKDSNEDDAEPQSPEASTG